MPSKVISLIRNVHFSGCDLVVGALAPDPESVDLWTWCQCGRCCSECSAAVGCGEAVNFQRFDQNDAAFQPCGRPRRPWRTSAPPWRSFRRGRGGSKPVCPTNAPRCPTPCRTPPAPTAPCPTLVARCGPRWPSWGPTPISPGYQLTED